MYFGNLKQIGGAIHQKSDYNTIFSYRQLPQSYLTTLLSVKMSLDTSSNPTSDKYLSICNFSWMVVWNKFIHMPPDCKIDKCPKAHMEDCCSISEQKEHLLVKSRKPF